MNKEKLENYLKSELSYADISKLENISKGTVKYWVDKYSIKFLSKYNREYQKSVDHNFLNKIDTKEKAYMVGFILGDGYISKQNDVALGLALADKELLNLINDAIPWECSLAEDLTFDKKTRRFPRARFNIRSRKFGQNLVRMFGARLASERHTPIISKHLRPYLVAGFFDADGCITWGYRKDRDRLWQKVNFTAAESILVGIQQILLDADIATSIKPKTRENVHLIEFASRKSVERFFNFLPVDGIRLQRKITRFQDLADKWV